MSEPSPSAAARPHNAPPPRGSKNAIHRVCIQCNNMFRVTPEHFDAKQCPNCHKG